MTGIEYLGGLREQYLGQYRNVLRTKREEGVECTAEVWVEPNVPPGQPRPPHPLCIDILVQASDGPAMVMVSDPANEGPRIDTMRVVDVPVKVYSTRWEDLAVWFRCPELDFSALEPWQRRWMDVNRGESDDEDGLSGVVHYLGRPLAEGGGHLYQVDFGSAPLEALTELLECLAGMGSTEIELGRSDGSDLPPEVLTALRSPELSTGMVTDVLCRLFSQVNEIGRIERLNDESIATYVGSSSNPHTVFTNNLHRMLMRTGIEARPKELYRFLRGERESIVPPAPPDLSQLRLLVKDDRFFESIKERAPKIKPLVRQHLAGDLWLTCVWDAPNGMRFATETEPGQYELSVDQMLRRAGENYLKDRPPVELAEDGALLVARTGDCYDATLLIDAKWLEEIAGKVRGDLLACVPARNIVLIGGAAVPQTLAQMRRAAKRIEAGGDHLISDTILVRRGGIWQVYQEPPAENPITVSGQPAPAPRQSRPWWRFWG